MLGGLALNGMVSAVNLQVDRLDPAARDTSYLLTSLVDEETGVRGYIISGQQSFLAPYRQGRNQTASSIAELHRLVDAYPALRPRLHAVETQADLWRSQYADPAIAAVMAHQHGPGRTRDDGQERLRPAPC